MYSIPKGTIVHLNVFFFLPILHVVCTHACMYVCMYVCMYMWYTYITYMTTCVHLHTVHDMYAYCTVNQDFVVKRRILVYALDASPP